MKLKKILNQVITERKQVGTVYHFTSLNSALQIVLSDNIRAATVTKNINQPTVSTTRDKHFSKSRMNTPLSISGADIAFVLNGDSLSDRYEVMPYDDTYVKSWKKFDTIDKEAFGDEREELWYGKQIQSDKGFKNVKKYTMYVIFTKRFLNKLLDADKLRPPHGTDKVDELFNDMYDASVSPQKKLKDVTDFFEKQGYTVKIEK